MSDKTPNCKVVLLGESGVGKTCIISRYVNNTYDEKSETTNGASYASKVIDFEQYQKSLRFDIWDTAGQEKYRSLTKFFYKDAAIAILVYDITRRDSFDEVKNYWYEQLKTCGEKNIVLGIAGNKCDMFDKEAVTEEEAEALAKQIGAQFKLTSAFKNNGIDELFKLVGNKYLDPNFQGEIITGGGGDKPEKIVLTKEDQKRKDKEKKNKGGCCK